MIFLFSYCWTPLIVFCFTRNTNIEWYKLISIRLNGHTASVEDGSNIGRHTHSDLIKLNQLHQMWCQQYLNEPPHSVTNPSYSQSTFQKHFIRFSTMLTKWIVTISECNLCRWQTNALWSIRQSVHRDNGPYRWETMTIIIQSTRLLGNAHKSFACQRVPIESSTSIWWTTRLSLSGCCIQISTNHRRILIISVTLQEP